MLALVVVVVVVILVLGVIAIAVRSARGQGTESDLVLRTHDELSEQHLAGEIGDLANTGIDVDGRLARPTVPEPSGPPPVAGAQWDEQAGWWIHWDPATEAWLPVPGAEPGPA